MMAEAQTANQPPIAFLELAEELSTLLYDVVTEEAYQAIRTRSADEIIALVERAGGPCLVISDNYHANPETRRLLEWLAAHPEARARVRVIGLAVSEWENPKGIDLRMALPLDLDDFMAQIERLGAEMGAGG